MRRIQLGFMLFPGQVRRRPNQQPPVDPPVTHAELVTVTTRMTFQAASIWQPFAIDDGGYTVEYTFTITFDISNDVTPVRAGTVDPGVWAEDRSDLEHTRPHRPARAEAVRHGFNNIVVVHRYFQAFGTLACAPALDAAGGIVQPTRSMRSAGLQTRASDVMWIGLNGVDPDDPRVSQTAAHEMGHMLGLASRGSGDGIMGRRRFDEDHRYVRRFLSDRDKELVHLAVESRVPGASVATHVLKIPTLPPTHRREIRVRPRH